MRLFWKILIGYFLAWALLSAALFGLLAFESWTQLLHRSPLSQALPTAVGVQIAATHVHLGGGEAFRRLADSWELGEPPYVIDAAGQEILGREVTSEMLEQARALAVDSSKVDSRKLVPVRRLTDLEGREFILFYPQGKGPQDRLPFHLLFDWPWLLGVVFAAAGLLLAGGLTAAWTRPIASLKAAFDTFAEDRLEPRVDPELTRRRDEIGDLARHFEAMARRLARSVAAQEQLFHDVSHELRSPLARLGVATELARKNPARTGEALDRVDRECQRLDRLIGEVLTLARLESDSAYAMDDYFDLLELLRVIRDDVAFEASSAGVEVVLEMPDLDELVMHGNAELLHRAVENVVRNALQHAGDSRRIEIVLDDPDGGSVHLKVRDHGPGLEAEALETLFEPFTRGGTSGGFGLGLAIARRAVAVHGGSIGATSPPGRGLEIRIDLPRRAD